MNINYQTAATEYPGRQAYNQRPGNADHATHPAVTERQGLSYEMAHL